MVNLLSIVNITIMNFKAELDKETGAYKIFNKKKDTYTSRQFKTKESAEKMCSVYENLGKPRTSTEPKKKILKKKKKPVEPVEE
jgi:hypothetical protein